MTRPSNGARRQGHVGSDRILSIQPLDFLTGDAKQFQTVPRLTGFGLCRFHRGLAALQLGQTHNLLFIQVLGAFVRQFRFLQLCGRLEIPTLRHTEVRTVERCQQGIFLHVLADIHMDLHHPTSDECGHLSQLIFIGLNCGGKFSRYQQRPSGNRRDRDHCPREFFGCEMEHSRPLSHNGLLGFRRLVGSPLASNKASECEGGKKNDPALFVKRET